MTTNYPVELDREITPAPKTLSSKHLGDANPNLTGEFAFLSFAFRVSSGLRGVGPEGTLPTTPGRTQTPDP